MRLRSGLAWALGATTTALVVSSVALAAATGESALAEAAFDSGIVAFGIAGSVISARRPANPVGWIAAHIGLLAALSTTASRIGDAYQAAGDASAGDGFRWVGEAVFFAPVGLAAFLFLLFPSGRLLSPRWKPVAWLTGIGTGLALLANVAAPRLYDPPIPNPLWAGFPEAITRSALWVAWPLVLGGFLTSVVSLVLRLRRSRGDERQQVKWLAYSAAMWAVVVIPTFLIGPSSPRALQVLSVAGFAALPISVAVAVLRYRLYDIDIVINKTIVYGALAAFITLVYVAVVVGIGALVGAGRQPNLGLQVAATALVAFLFQPARGRLQRVANRVVYGARATPFEVVSTLASQLSEVPAVEDVVPRMAEAASRGVGAARAMVRLYLPAGDSQTVVWPEGAAREDWDAQLDVTHAGDKIGEIAVAKSRGEALRPNEVALLEDLAGQAGLALHNVRLTAELRAQLVQIRRQADEINESRARLLSAQDEERRRLERVISTGVERRLAAIESDLESTAELVATDGNAAAASLDAIGARTQAALEELRDLARGIFPPLLADRGIVAALEGYTAKRGTALDLVVDDDLRTERLGEALEAAVYFCVVEALQDLSSARSVRVEVRREDDDTNFRVEGVVLSLDARQRIRDRVEALGGTLSVTSAPGEGTVVAGRVPPGTAEAAS